MSRQDLTRGFEAMTYILEDPECVAATLLLGYDHYSVNKREEVFLGSLRELRDPL